MFFLYGISIYGLGWAGAVIGLLILILMIYRFTKDYIKKEDE